ncbi:TPA: hypothetical protein ACH3X1_016199, partial [Trebouxia sp. C0004]
MHVSPAGCRHDEPSLERSQSCDFEILHWAWQGVSRSALKQAMSLASTNPHQMLPAETAVGSVALFQ